MPANDAYNEIIIKNGVKVAVPDSLNLMTPFVLQEQQDWFEDEIKFLRSYIKPGMKVIDIGANYGTYALTMAKIIGDSGRLWAFEPASATAGYLQQSIENNNLKNTTLIQAGLSNKTGKAKLFTSNNSELNSLTKKSGSEVGSEKINLLTLDYCFNKYKWKSIDFIKLDAEGEESNILKKGKNTLSSLSPFIMFELKHGETVNLPLITKFSELGYDCYRLVPGLNTLVPFNHDDPVDAYLLNLFCCKQDKLMLLEDEGVIVRNWIAQDSVNPDIVKSYFSATKYWDSLTDINLGSEDADYQQVLNAYILSLSESESSSHRVACLMTSLDRVKELISRGEQRIECLTTFSRIAFDAGERNLGVEILGSLIDKYREKLDFDIREPFLPACSRYDQVSPGNQVKEWLFSSILEQYLTKCSYSAYFNAQRVLPFYELLSGLGFQSEDMKRRHELIKTAFT